MTRNNALLKSIKTYVAITTVGPSVARGAGAPGAVDSLRRALDEDVDLSSFATPIPTRHRTALDSATQSVASRLPSGARSWGLARKAVNLFLRESLYNFYLREEFGLSQAEALFEIPLDRVVGTALRVKSPEFRLPVWPGLKHLTPALSDLFQSAADSLAHQREIARVHLDAALWTENR